MDIIERKFSILFDWFEQMADLFTALARSEDQENRNAMREAFLR